MRWYLIPTTWQLPSPTAKQLEGLVEALCYDLVDAGAGEAVLLDPQQLEEPLGSVTNVDFKVAVYAASDEQALKLGREIWPFTEANYGVLEQVGLPVADDNQLSPTTRTMLSWARDWIVGCLPLDLAGYEPDEAQELLEEAGALPLCYFDHYDADLIERYSENVKQVFDALVSQAGSARLTCVADLFAAHGLIQTAYSSVRYTMSSEIISEAQAAEVLNQLDQLRRQLLDNYADMLMIFEMGPHALDGYSEQYLFGQPQMHPACWFDPLDSQL